jgi:hypothetical protein
MPVGCFALFPWVAYWLTHAIGQVGLAPSVIDGIGYVGGEDTKHRARRVSV